MTPVEKSLLDSFEPARREPEWLASARRDALARFEQLGLPTSRHEDWRFTSLAGLTPLSLGRPRAADGAALLARTTSAREGTRLVFVNGRFRPDLSARGALPPGAMVSTLAEALLSTPELVRPHLGRLARPDDHAFVAANTALFEDGAFVHLPAGASLAEPVGIVFLSDAAGGPAASHPRTLIVVGEGARAAIAEAFVGDGGPYLTNAVTEIVLADGAQVEHVRLQSEARDAFHVSVLHAEEGAGASA